MTEPAISVHGLVKHYGDRAVVDRVGFTVESGTAVALLGPNGAGKTTTVEIIEGYRRPDEGNVRVLGLDPVGDGRVLRPRVGVMLQSGGIYPQASPIEMLRLHAAFFRDPLDPGELIGRVGLADVASSRYRNLSGGERQRLSLALALVGRPELLILDEPTAGMDPEARAATRELLAELRDGGATILLTTHDLADVERLADRIVLIAGGRVVAVGTPAELTSGAFPRLRFRLAVPLARPDLDALRARLLGDAGGEGRIQEDGAGRYRIEGVRLTPELVGRLANWCAGSRALIIELRAGGGTLEERYLELIGEAGQDPAPVPDPSADRGADR